MEHPIKIGFAAVGILVGAVLIDIVGSEEEPPRDATIIGRSIIPTNDLSSKRSRIEPEEYFVHLDVTGGGGLIDVKTTKQVWVRAENGFPAVVVARRGLLSGSSVWTPTRIGNDATEKVR